MKVQTENKSFQRDTHSKALLMNDRRALDEYKMKKKILNDTRARDEELNTLKAKVAEMDTNFNEKLDEITNLLKGLVSK